MRIVVWPSVISQPAAPRCVRRSRAARARRARVMRRVPGLMATPSAAAEWLSRAGAAGDLPGLDQLDPHVVRRLHERDSPAIRHLDRALEQAGSQPLEPPDVGLEVRRVEAEVLEAVMGAG